MRATRTAIENLQSAVRNHAVWSDPRAVVHITASLDGMSWSVKASGFPGAERMVREMVAREFLMLISQYKREAEQAFKREIEQVIPCE